MSNPIAAGNLLQKIDADNSGSISLTEFTDYYMSRDLDGNGKVTKEEVL